MPIQLLPSSTIKLISSTQVITSVSSVVKELIENSLDAGATNIEIKLDNHGFGRVEVKDNGKGVKREDVQYMCQKSYTSKINNFDDLYKLCTYGFRGEALNSLCAVAKVSITTISEGDDLAMTYEFDHSGVLTSNKISHIAKGSIVVVENLFKNLPVRKQFLTSGRKKMEEIKKVEQVVKTLAVIHPKLRAVLTHNKFCIWQKNCVSTLRQSLVQIIAPTIVKQLTDIEYKSEMVSFDLLVPARACNVASTCYGNPGDATYLFINLRPIKNKAIEKIVQDEIFNYFGHEILSGRYPTCLISINLPPGTLDVNLEPNKTRVIIRDMEKVGNILKKQLVLYYVGPIETPKEFLDAIDEEVNKYKGKRKNDGNGKPEKKLKVDAVEPVGYMDDEDLDDCDKQNIQLINNCDEPKNITESAFLNYERESNVISFMDGIDNSKDKISIVSEVEKSSESESNDLMDSQAPFFLQTSNVSSQTGGSGASVENISVENVTLSQWSRGNVKLDDGITINSSTLLLDNKVDSKENSSCIFNSVDPFSPEESGIESKVELHTPERSISSQMGCKDMAGFTKYASEMTCKIGKSSEGLSFTKIAGELASKWREMHDAEKEKYIEKSKQKQKEKEDKANKFMREQLEKFLKNSSEKKKHKKKSYYAEIAVDVNIEDLKISIKKRQPIEQGFGFLGELNEDVKCVGIGSDVYVFSTRRLQESLLFHKHLRTMIIPLKVLESGIVVDKELLGESLWAVLISLETAIDVKCGAIIISDQRISKNGLRIELVKGDPTGCTFKITDLPLHIAFYGVEDLIEILSLIETSGTELPLEDCRPLKILSYIRGETIRFISKNDLDIQCDHIIEEFRYWLENIKPKTKRCPHQKAVFKRIDLKDFIK